LYNTKIIISIIYIYIYNIFKYLLIVFKGSSKEIAILF
jgi:hypothetical protein